MKCIGFGEFEGKCSNVAGTAWGPYWCYRCTRLRFVHMDNQFKEINKRFEKAEATQGGKTDGTKADQSP